MRERGYVLEGVESPASALWRDFLALAVESFRHVPEDPHHDPRSAGRRHRCASRLELRPGKTGSMALSLFPGAVHAGQEGVAAYPGVFAQVLEHPGFQALLGQVLSKLPEGYIRSGLQISVHQMRVVDGVVHPEGRHQDEGADYLAVWSPSRENARGGVNALWDRARGGAALLKRALRPGELLVFDNRALWHDISPLSRDEETAGEAVRDVFVLAIAPLREEKLLAAPDRAAMLSAIRSESGKARPELALLRRFFEKGDRLVKDALLRAFLRWGRWFSRGGEDWSLGKAAFAPWAGRVYVRRLESFFDYLSKKGGGGIDAERESKAVHQADKDFSLSLVSALEALHGVGLDLESAAEDVSDRALYEVLFRPLLDPAFKGRLRRGFERGEFVRELAAKLKNTVYLHSPGVSAEDIEGMLAREPVAGKLKALLDKVEPYLPEGERAPEAGEASRSGIAGAEGARRLGGTLGMALLAVGVWAAWAALTGNQDGIALLAFLGTTAAAGVKSAGAEPGGPSSYLSDLTQAARDGQLQPIYLRDGEISRLIQVLNQSSHNNAVLIGEPGVGKTAIAEGLAQEIAREGTGTELDRTRVLLLDVGKFLAAAGSTPDRFAKTVEALLKEAADGNTVLVIDEAHQLARENAVPGLGSIFDQLKPAMTRGRLKLILATTSDEYNRYFAQDRALESRTTKVLVEPVREDPAIELLNRPEIKSRFERGVRIGYAAAEAAVRLTVRAFRFSALLRMAIKALDTAATRLRIKPAETRRRLNSARRELIYHVGLLAAARKEGDLGRQERLIRLIAPMLSEYARLSEESRRPARVDLTARDVAEALEELGAPTRSLKAGTREELGAIEVYLRENLIGHEGLISETMRALGNAYAQPNRRKPIFSALLLGPTGTGKTEYVRVLGKALFGIGDLDKEAIKIDGSQFQERHEISRLIGSPPGYVGFRETTTLLDKVREKKATVILVDEAEKMHPDILKYFLSILEDGSAKDAEGRAVDFSNTVVVFTSNQGVPAGYEGMEEAALSGHIREALYGPGSRFPPELLNRFSLVDVFGILKEEEARRIAALRLEGVRRQWKADHGVEVAYADEGALIEALLAEGYSRKNGARAINRVLDARVQEPLTRRLIGGELRTGMRATLGVDGSVSAQGEAPGRSMRLKGNDPGAQALAEGIEELLESGDWAPERLDALLGGGEREAAAPAPLPEFPASFSVELKEHAPGRKDGELQAVLEKLKAALDGAGEEAKAGVLDAVKVLSASAKRLNVGRAAREDGDLSLEELEARVGNARHAEHAAATQRLVRAVERAGSERRVKVSWGSEKGLLRLSAESQARSRAEDLERLRRIFGEAEYAESSDPQGMALSEKVQALRKAGGRAGYGKNASGELGFWLEWASPPAKPAPPAGLPRASVVKPAAEPPSSSGESSASAPALDASPEPPAASKTELFRLVEGLMAAGDDVSAQAAYDAFAKRLAERAGEADAALETLLRSVVRDFIQHVGKAGIAGYVVTVLVEQDVEAGRKSWVPALKIRKLFAAYRELLRARPDLVRTESLSVMELGFPDSMGYTEQASDLRHWISEEMHPVLFLSRQGKVALEPRSPTRALFYRLIESLNRADSVTSMKGLFDEFRQRLADKPAEADSFVEALLRDNLHTFIACLPQMMQGTKSLDAIRLRMYGAGGGDPVLLRHKAQYFMILYRELLAVRPDLATMQSRSLAEALLELPTGRFDGGDQFISFSRIKLLLFETGFPLLVFLAAKDILSPYDLLRAYRIAASEARSRYRWEWRRIVLCSVLLPALPCIIAAQIGWETDWTPGAIIAGIFCALSPFVIAALGYFRARGMVRAGAIARQGLLERLRAMPPDQALPLIAERHGTGGSWTAKKEFRKVFGRLVKDRAFGDAARASAP